MRILTQNEIQALRLSSIGDISKEALNKQFPIKPTIAEIHHYLEQSLGGDFETMWELTNLLDKESDKAFHREYLLKEGHYLHENMAGAFQTYFNDDASSIPTLISAISQPPDYFDPYPYIRKLIYAIGAQPEPYNLQALEEVAKSDDPEIQALALHQIQKRKELGRWEGKRT